MTALGQSGGQGLRWVWLASEALLVATSVATVFMLQRIFTDDTFLAPLLFTLIVGHGILISMRWFGFGAVTSALVSLLATATAIVVIHYSATAFAAVVPTSETIDQFRIDMTQSQELFQSTKTPVPAVTGFLVVSSLGLWIMAFAADWAAFRLFAPGQALIPFLSMLVFVSMLGVEEKRLGTTATALVCGVLFLLAHRSAARAAHGVWLDHGPGRGYVSLMTAGGIVAVIAALAGVLGGPAVPGANEAPLVTLGDDSREESRPLEVISPLVQIQPRLIDQSDAVLFTVETNQRAYWRIAALDVFDGSLWRSQGQFRSANDALPVDYPSDAPVDSVRSTFDLSQLNVVWAPAAYLPIRFENLSGAGVNYESESATFIVDTNAQQVSDGLVYAVTSQIPRFTAETLRQLAAESNQVADGRYLDLPDDYSSLARQTAEQLTAGMTSPYDKALALQNYFRDNFTYDIDVAKGHDIERLEDFLTVQRGYCEQFAGAYASMARAIGLPSRVATGFTPGDPDPNNPNRYLVRGRHAHAWPEVFIAGAGWVGFEPTPGRGAPNATEYTGVPEAQDSFESNSESADGAEEVPAAAADELNPAGAPTPTPVPPQQSEVQPPLVQDEQVDPALEGSGPGSTALRNLLVFLGALAAWVIGVPALKRWRQRRRLARIGTTPRRRITLAWAGVADFLESQGQEPFESETLQEYSHRVQRDQLSIYPAFGELTELAVEASYRSAPPTNEQAEAAEVLGRDIVKQLVAAQPWPVRGARELDPRPLIKRSDPVADLADRLAAGAST
jgi:transglutaminase-like putative cysteine protease